MSLSVKFDGQELSKILTVTKDFTPFLGVSWDISTYNNNGALRGENFHYSTFKGKTISMPFKFRYDVAEKYDNLERILNVDEPKPLIFGNIPDRVFYAVPKGNLNFKEIAFLGKGTIEWFIPDGVAHANVTKTTTQTYTNEDGILEMVVQNKGTEWAPISFEIENTSNNGYIGIVSEYGVMEFGNREEVDKELAYDSTKSVVLANNKKGDFADWTNGTVFYQDQNKKAVTTMSYDAEYGGRLGMLPANFSNTTNSNFFGAIKEKIFTETAKDWYLWGQAWFEAGLPSHTGMWTIAVIGENGKMIAGYILRKADINSTTAQCYFVLNGVIVKTINFIPNGLVAQNPYSNESRIANRNSWDLLKEGDKFTFFWYGGYYSFVNSELKDVKAERLQFFVGQFKGRTSGNQLVTRMYINNISFRKNNVEYWRDVPNRFNEGDILFADGTEKKTYFNGMLAQDMEVKGTKYFKIPPGETKIQFYYSSFASAPKVKATIREVFL